MHNNRLDRRRFVVRLASGLAAGVWLGCGGEPRRVMPQPEDHPFAARLALPEGKVRAVLDTDTYNEIDDQFALAYAARSQQEISLEAVYAAPFVNRRAQSAAEGMKKSYEEIHRVLDILGHPAERESFVFRGSDGYLPSPEAPVESAAAEDLIARALAPGGKPLYVVAVGAPTNVASALLLEPKIKDHVVVVWVGAQPYSWASAADFNSRQDIAASQTLFDCGVPLINIPAFNVSEHMRTTPAEMERFLRNKSKIADYLLGIFLEYAEEHRPAPDFPYSKVIWDIAGIGLLVNPEWVSTELTSSPIFQDDMTWARDESRHPVRAALRVNRDAIFNDLFQKLGE